MTKEELNSMWNYYLSLEDDLSRTSQYVEPMGQETVYSFEFAKLLVLACTEIESVFKALCFEIEGKQVKGDIGAYKTTILRKFPKVVDATVNVSRLGRQVKPFEEWSCGKLKWWDAYQEVKHSRGLHFNLATYYNAMMALAALYIAIFYLAKYTKIEFPNYVSKYIESDYENTIAVYGPTSKLPDFEGD